MLLRCVYLLRMTEPAKIDPPLVVACEEKVTYASPAVSPRFPQELFDEVIDNLRDDMATLKSCSLVCQAWIRTTSIHLFRSLFWPPCPHVWTTFNDRTDPALPCTGASHYGGFSSCVELVSRSPRVCNAVKELSLHSMRPHLDEDHSVASYIESLAPDDIFAMMALFPRLHTLELYDCSFLDSPVASTPHATKTIKNLYIVMPSSGLRALTLPATLSLLRHFSQIENVVIEGNLPREPFPLLPPSAARTKLGTLTLLPSPSGLDSWEARDLRRLRKTIQGLGEYIDTSALRHLDVQSQCPQNFIDALHGTPSLTSLTYYTHMGMFDAPRLHREAPLQFLSITVPLHYLNFFIHYPRHGRVTEWTLLMDHLYSMAHFPLQSVRLVLKHCNVGESLVQAPNGSIPEGEPFMSQINRLLRATNWALLANFVERCPSVKNITLEIQLKKGCVAVGELLEGVVDDEGRRLEIPRSAMGQQSTIDRLDGVVHVTMTESPT